MTRIPSQFSTLEDTNGLFFWKIFIRTKTIALKQTVKLMHNVWIPG
jgi:hypothetical protein